MKVWGLGNTFHVINRITARSLEILLLSCWLIPASNLSPIHPQRLRDPAPTQFDPSMPGLHSLMFKIKKEGFAFELEAALMLAEKERIIGFDLDLCFLKQQATVCIAGQAVELATTEFDIVTNHWAVECKCLKHPKKRNIHQFIKEKIMIAWCQELAKEITANEITFSFMASAKGVPFVVINGPATFNKSTPITSSWLTAATAEGCVEQFKDVINLLSTKQPCVFFSRRISPEFASTLRHSNITFEDNIHFGYKDDTHLIAQFSRLSTSPDHSSP